MIKKYQILDQNDEVKMDEVVVEAESDVACAIKVATLIIDFFKAEGYKIKELE